MRWKDILTESVRKFEPMFHAFRQEGKMPEWVAQRIKRVEGLLGREDRVVWALRWERYKAALKANNHDLAARFASDLTMTMAPQDEVEYFDTMMDSHFAHWFSLGSDQINKLTFLRQSPDQLWTELSEAEADWKAKRKQVLNHAKDYPDVESEEDDEYEPDPYDYEDHEEYEKEARQRELKRKGNIYKLIDFHNGWAWWNLNRTYCSTEGSAMGHCGNKPSAQPDDTVLSLRFDKGKGNYRPSLTFILNTSTGMLIETKGRANEKPNQKYHKMIVALLRNPMIRGIDGGGYASDNNFSILDLPEELRNELIKEKPGLLSVYDRLNIAIANPTEENQSAVKQAIDRRIQHYGLSYKDLDWSAPEQPQMILLSWKTPEAFQNMQHDYRINLLDKFFGELEEDISDLHLRDVDPDQAANDLRYEHYVPCFRELIHYSDEFILSGVHYDVSDTGEIKCLLSVKNFLNASPEDEHYFGDEEWDQVGASPNILERLSSLWDSKDDSYDHIGWSDVDFSHVDASEEAILKYCFKDEAKDAQRAVDALVSEIESADSHYYSRHPDQLELDV